MASAVTFKPLGKNRYRAIVRVSGSPVRSFIIKGSKTRYIRRQIENEGRESPPPVLVVHGRRKAAGLKVKEYFLPNEVKCPACQSWLWRTRFGNTNCEYCETPFTIEPETF